MLYKQNNDLWKKACDDFDNGEYLSSIHKFTSFGDDSRVHFNIGRIFSAAHKHDEAIKSYDMTIRRDPYMAAAYFQRGVSYFIKNDIVQARSDFDKAYEKMRENSVIKYYKLGLPFQLYSCEVLFNRGICHLKLGKIDAGLNDLYSAQKSGTTSEHTIFEKAVRDRGKGYSIFSIPPNVIYRPFKNNLEFRHDGSYVVTYKADDSENLPKGNNSIILDHHHFKNARNSSYSYDSLYESDAYMGERSSTSSGSNRNTQEFDTYENRYSSSSSKASQSDSYIKEDAFSNDFDQALMEVYSSFNNIPVGSGSQPMSTMRKLKIKVHYNDTRILLASSFVTFEELVIKIKQKFNTEKQILLKYKDEEGEFVLLIGNDDLNIARNFRERVSPNDGLEKLELWCSDT